MRRMLLAGALLVTGAGLVCAQFYSSLPADGRAKLAEDYYLAGGQYVVAGDETKGREFQDFARLMYPALDPKAIVEIERPSAAELLAKSSIPVAAPREADTTPGLIRSRLLRLIGSILTESPDDAVQNLDGSVYFTDAGIEVSRDSARLELASLFSKVSLRGVQPSRLYALETLRVERGSADLSGRGWGTVYTADVDARMDLSKDLPVWAAHQRFLFRESAGGGWLVFAVGSAMPPVGWKPAPLAAGAAPAPAGAAPSTSSIEASFLDCVARFLQKDAEGALRYFAPRVRIERLGATVAREELGKAFQSYFAAMSFGGLKTEDLVEPQSVFVAETDRFADLAAAPRYVLTVKTRVDLAETIPFWTRFQEYYFNSVEGSWRIFAIF
jgi:hypothetical protein